MYVLLFKFTDHTKSFIWTNMLSHSLRLWLVTYKVFKGLHNMNIIISVLLDFYSFLIIIANHYLNIISET